MVARLVLFAIGSQAALHADSFIRDLPFRVEIGIPRVFSGMEKGPIKCFDKGNLVSQVLTAYGFNPEISDPHSEDVQQYHHNSCGPRLGEGNSAASIVNVFTPLSAAAASDAVLPDVHKRWVKIEERAAAFAQTKAESLIQRGRVPTPMEKKIQYIAEVFRGLIEDPTYGSQLLDIANNYSRNRSGFINDLARDYSEAKLAEVEASARVPVPEAAFNWYLGYSAGQRSLIINRAVATMLLGLFISEPADVVDEETSQIVTPAFHLLGTRFNFADKLCEASELALSVDPEIASEIRCALQTSFAGMMACSPAPLDCSVIETRDWTDYKRCNKPSIQDPTKQVKAIIPNMRLVPRDQVHITPGVIPTELINQEGETYLFGWRGVYTQAAWTGRAVCRDSEAMPPEELSLVPGWNIKLELWTGPEGCGHLQRGESQAYPFAAISEKEDEPCKFLVINRGTSSDCEWFFDIDTKLDPMILDRHRELDILAHRGALSLHNSVWPAARNFFVEDVLPRCPQVTVSVVGHSLGGSMALLWGVRLADLLEGRLHEGEDVDTLSLSPIRSISRDSWSQIEASSLPLNVRVVKHEMDAIIGIPCAMEHGMELCSTRSSIGPAGRGTQEPYGDPTNTISMTAEYMETLHPNNFYYRNQGFLYFSTAGLQMSLPASLNVGMGHSCALDCLASSFCTTTQAYKSGCDFTTAVGKCTASNSGLGPPNTAEWDWAPLKCHNNVVTEYPCAL